MWSIEEYQAVDAESELEDEWNELFDSNTQHSLPNSFLWFKAWNRSFGKSVEASVVCVRKNNQLVLVAPLVRESQNFKIVQLDSARLACNRYAPACSMLVSDALTLDELGRTLQSLVEHVDEPLFRIPQLSGADLKKLKTVDRVANYFVLGVETVRVSPMIDVSGDWDEYFKSRSKLFRKGMRRKLKKVKSLPDVAISKVRPENRDDAMFAEIFNTSGRSWKADADSCLAEDSEAQEFLLTLVDLLAPEGGILVWQMCVDSQLVAFEYQVQFRNVCYPLRADFDSEHADISPGIVLLYHTIKDLFDDDNSHMYDCCSDDYDYLTSWAQSSEEFAMLDLFAQRPKALVVHGLKYRLLPWLRQLAAA